MSRILVLVICLCFVFLSNSVGQKKPLANSVGQKKALAKKIPTVDLCNLLDEKGLWNNKIVRVKSTYFRGFEGSLMRDSGCYDEAVWVRFGNSVEASTPREVWNQFELLTATKVEQTSDGGRYVTYPQIVVTWIGLFQSVKAKQKNGKSDFRSGFGHLNGFDFQFTVRKIERASEFE
jgi:hypothetical protein